MFYCTFDPPWRSMGSKHAWKRCSKWEKRIYSTSQACSDVRLFLVQSLKMNNFETGWGSLRASRWDYLSFRQKKQMDAAVQKMKLRNVYISKCYENTNWKRIRRILRVTDDWLIETNIYAGMPEVTYNLGDTAFEGRILRKLFWVVQVMWVWTGFNLPPVTVADFQMK